jgi:hypothetical protein
LDASIISECVEKCEEEGYDAIAVHNTSDLILVFGQRSEILKEIVIEMMN